MRALVNAAVYTPTRIIPQGVVLCEGERIAAVGSARQVTIPADAEVIDVSGLIACPGFVDIHTHAGDGGDFTDGTPEAVRQAARRHRRAGTTSLLATTSSEVLAHILGVFGAIREVMEAPAADEARILGIHMEGPFLSLEQRGAHPPELLRMPDAAEREQLLAWAPWLRCVTLAPERAGALELIDALAARGIVVAGGHSDGTYEQVCEAMNRGMRHTVHCWSGMSTVRRIKAKRYAGMVEASLMEEGLTTEIIADGYHLPSSLMRMAYRLKGPSRLALVSDAMRASGLGPGTYHLSGHICYVDEGEAVAYTEDRLAFAGSVATLLQCVQQVVLTVGISLIDALCMASLTPARIMGLDVLVGSLEPGKLADILLLDPATLEVRRIIQGGEIVVG